LVRANTEIFGGALATHSKGASSVIEEHCARQPQVRAGYRLQPVAAAEGLPHTWPLMTTVSAEAARLTPIATEQRAGAVVLAAAGMIFSAVSPLAADGERLWQWSDLLLVALALGGIVWLRRQRRDYGNAALAPSSAALADKRSVIRRYAIWGAPYLLLVLLAATTIPALIGFGFACVIYAVGLALEARYTTTWEVSSGARLYRGRSGWSERTVYRAL
jgi:hypothetical protein